MGLKQHRGVGGKRVYPPLEAGSPLISRLRAGMVHLLLSRDLMLESEPLRSRLKAIPTVVLEWFRFLKHRPLMSILIPVYNTDPEVLKRCIDSVLAQVYKKWELCIVDDASTLPEVVPILEGYAGGDSRIRIQVSERNNGIAATINKAAKMASGDYLGVLDHDDELVPLTLFEYVRKINEHPDTDCIYCDEDKINENGNYCDPWLKSDWNPDLALSFNYVMHFAVYRRELFEKLGGVRPAYEGSQDYDLLLRASERTDKIYHIPKILYHWRKGRGSISSGPENKPEIFETGLAALNNALSRRGIEGTAEHAPNAWKGVYRVRREIIGPLSCSIIIASHGNVAELSRLLNSIFAGLTKRIREVLVGIHSSKAYSEKEILEQHKGVTKCIRFDGSDTVPRAFNAGASHASGDVIFFLDETMEVISSATCSELLGQAQREEVGAVGGKVLYPNGFVEHAGVILGPFNILGYAHRATPDVPGYGGLKAMICNYSAVTGFGMMTRRRLFMDLGGFSEKYENAYWDVDYCLRLRGHGYLITYTPYAVFRHHVPIGGINDVVVEPEATLFRRQWQSMIDTDPYFNPNFSRKSEDFSFNRRALYSDFMLFSQVGRGYYATSDLWIKAVMKPTWTNWVSLRWRKGGEEVSPEGDTTVWGYFYADPSDFPYGSPENPEVFVKIYIAPDGGKNIVFNHVTVDDVDVGSAYQYDGNPDQEGTITLQNRVVAHLYEP